MFKKALLFICTLLIIQNRMHAAAHASLGEEIVALAHRGDFNAIRTLTIKHGVDSTDDDNNTLLHYAARNCSYRLINFLINNGASVNAQNNNLDTPLHLAATQGATRSIGHLFRAGADPRFVNRQGETAFSCAKKLHHSYAASLCATPSDDQNPYPTSIAPWEDQQSFLQQHELMYHQEQLKRAQLAAQLDAAVFSGDLSTVGLLIANNVPGSFRGPYGNTVLHTALLTPIHPDFDTIFDLLLGQEDALLDAQNLRGETPLHIAALTANKKAFDALIAAGANPDLLNNDGKTATMIWEEFKQKAPQKTLEEAPTKFLPHAEPSSSALAQPSEAIITEQAASSQPQKLSYATAAKKAAKKKTVPPSTALITEPSSSSLSSSGPRSWIDIMEEEAEYERRPAQAALLPQPKKPLPSSSSSSTAAHRNTGTDAQTSTHKNPQRSAASIFRKISKIMQKSYSESAQIIYLTYLFETQQKPCSFSLFFEQIEAEYGKDFCSPDMRNRVETLVRLRKETLADLQAAATKWEVTAPLVLIILRHAALQLKENPSNLGKILNEELTICKQFKISIHFIFALLIRYGKSQELVDGVSPLKTFFQERLEYEKKEGLIVKKAPIKPPFPLSGGKKIPETFSTGPEELDEAGESSIYSSKPRTRFKDRVLYLLNNSDHTTRSWSITTLLILYAQKASALPEALATVNQKFNQNITPDSIEYQRALVFFKRQKVVLDNCNRFFTPSPKFSQKQLLRHNTLMQVGLYTQIFEPQIRLTNICFIAKRLFGIRSIPIFFSVLKNFQESSAGTVAEEHDVPPEQIL